MAIQRPARKRGWLVQFLLRAVLALGFVHYVSLLFLFHGMAHSPGSASRDDVLAYIDLPMSEVFRLYPHAQQEEVQPAPGPRTPTPKPTAPPARILWAIESTASDQGKQRRQAIRETYLSFRDLLNQDATKDSLFCSLNGLEAGILNIKSGCQFFYTFVIPDDSYFGQSKEEADVWLWDKVDSGGLLKWLSSMRGKNQQYQWQYLGWVDDQTIVAPLEILDLLKQVATYGSDNHVVLGTPEGNMGLNCDGKCAWDRETLLRHGKILVVPFALLIASAFPQVSCSRSDGQDTAKAIRTCLVSESGGGGARVVDLTIGHQYAEQDVDQYRALWEQHMEMVQFYNRLQRKHKVHYISAWFNRDTSRNTNKFRDLKTALVHWGFHPSQIYLYDGVFPDFILRDHRWEQHLEFLQDSEVSDLGAGFWFWKAALFEHHLNLLDEGDFVIFSNVGFWDHLPWLYEMLETMMSRQANMGAYCNFFPENEWTKRELYELLCSHIPDRFMPNDRSNQYTGHFLVLRKSQGTMDFVQRFTRLSANYHLISDEQSILPEYPEFREHRRDQSIISLLLKCKYQESGKQLFSHPSINELGWFEASTFHLEPLPSF